MEKVADLLMHLMTRVNQNGKKIMLSEEEVTTLEEIILVTSGIIVMAKEKIDLGLRALVLSVEKDIEPFNVAFLAKRFEAVVEIS